MTSEQALAIAEVFVEAGRVRVQIEIGGADLAAFENLLPAEIRAKENLSRVDDPAANRIYDPSQQGSNQSED